MPSERSTLLDQCTLEVERCAPALMQRCVDAAVAALQSAENASQRVAQRQQLAQAAWSLTQNRSSLSRTYPLGWTEPEDGHMAPQYVLSRLSKIAGPDA